MGQSPENFFDTLRYDITAIGHDKSSEKPLSNKIEIPPLRYILAVGDEKYIIHIIIARFGAFVKWFREIFE